MRIWQRRRDEDFAAEVEAHLQLEADRLVEEGLAPDAARQEARRRFGNPVRVREAFYYSQRYLWVDHLRQDLVTAWRAIRRYPIACTIAIVSLAAGIGATATTLVLRNAIFRSPPPLYAAPESLHFVRSPTPENPRRLVPAGLFRSWMAEGIVTGTLAASAPPRQLDVRAGDQDTSNAIRAVTPELFSVLGVPPMLGTPLDQLPPGGAPPAVLSAGAWLRLFGGREEGVIGRTILIDGVPHTVAAVMPQRFWFGAMDAPIWTRADLDALSPDATLNVVARRAPGSTESELSRDLRAAAERYAATLPEAQRRLAVSLTSIRGTPLGNNVGPMVLVLLTGAVLLTLAIACTNVAVLMMAQWTARAHEIAVRASLGSSRGRIVRALLTESVAIAVAAGALGAAVTYALCGLARQRVPTADLYALSLDAGVLAQTAALSMAVGVLAGLLPALYETRRLHTNPLSGVRGPDRVRQRWRHGLVVFEIAATVALLVSAGAMLASYAKALGESPGFDTRALLTARVDHRDGVDPSPLIERLKATPGVAAAAATTIAPYISPGEPAAVSVDPSVPPIQVVSGAVGDGFLDALGAGLVAGRAIDERDTAASEPVAVINDVLAAQLMGTSTAGAVSAVGRRLSIVPGEGPAQRCPAACDYTVIGVMTAFAITPNDPVRPLVLTAYSQLPARPGRAQLLIRAAGDAAPLIQTVRRELTASNGGTTVAAVVTVDQIRRIAGQEIIVGTMPLVPLIATGMLLTAAGIYGVLAFSVTRRSTELAVRLAVGAERQDLVRLVAVHSGRLLALGTAIGIGLTYALTRLAQGHGGAFDSPGWEAFVVPVVLIVIVVGAGTIIPIRRVLAIEPTVLLRTN